MCHLLQDLLGRLRITDFREAGGLQVFGILGPRREGLPYSTLDEALVAGLLEVSEVSEAGQVPTIRVVNKSDTPVLMMAGEQLRGARQDRVLTVSLLIAGQTDLPVPVSCVEAGRWTYRSPGFVSSGTAAHSRLRLKMAKHARETYGDSGRSSRQSEVWEEVDRKLKVMGSSSPSQALSQAYEDQAGRLDEILRGLPPPPGATGAVFAFGGHIAGMDLFGHRGALKGLWPKLVRGYALDALEAERPVNPVGREAVARWLATAGDASGEPSNSPGLGAGLRFQGGGVVGAALVVEGEVVHLELFPAE